MMASGRGFDDHGTRLGLALDGNSWHGSSLSTPAKCRRTTLERNINISFFKAFPSAALGFLTENAADELMQQLDGLLFVKIGADERFCVVGTAYWSDQLGTISNVQKMPLAVYV